MNRVKLYSYIAAVTFAVILAAGCTAPMASPTPAPSATAVHNQNVTAALDAQIAARYDLIDNFTVTNETNATPSYVGAFADENGTIHTVTVFPANSTAEAQAQFEAQKTTYSDIASEPNATVDANTSTHWAVRTNDVGVSVWYTEPNTTGPFDLSLDVPYVVLSEDTLELLNVTSSAA